MKLKAETLAVQISHFSSVFVSTLFLIGDNTDSKRYREYVYSVAVNKEISDEVGRIDDFRALARILLFLPTELDIFDIRQHYIRLLFIFQRLILLSFIISYSDKHIFNNIWYCISCCNDVMNRIDCVIKRDVYPQKMYSCSKDIRCRSRSIRKKIMGDIAWIFALLKDKMNY